MNIADFVLFLIAVPISVNNMVNGQIENRLFYVFLFTLWPMWTV